MSEHLRDLNIALGVIAVGMLCFRTPRIVMKLTSKRLYFALSAFPILVCFGSVHAVAAHTAHSPVTPFFTASYLALDSFLIWLPKGLKQ